MRELGDFALERQLGRWATAQVYLARPKNGMDNAVALKIFHPGLWDREELKRRAVAEFHAVSVLKHPNIVQMIEPFWDLDPPAVALEFIDGVSLEEFQPRLPYILPEVAVLVLIEVLSALEHAHAAGIIHRDLKPANILVSNTGRVCVSDFGLAKMTDASRLTLSGTILGSPDFMSPEQARGDVTSPRSDLFSAAAVLYFLITGTRPFSRHSPLATLAAVCESQAEPAQRRNPKLSAELAGIIRRGFSKKPEDRFGSAAEFKKALSDYLCGLGLTHERFNLPLWMRSSTEISLDAMKQISDSLIQRAETKLVEHAWDDVLGCVAHLSLVAPESAAIPRLMEELEKRQNQPKSRPYLLAGVAAILLIGIGGWVFSQSGSEPAQTAVVRTEEIKSKHRVQRKVQTEVVARPAVPKRNETKPRKSLVRFDVDPSVRVQWDGKEIDPTRPLREQTEGFHQLRLEKPGLKPIEQRIHVSSSEPNVIRVR